MSTPRAAMFAARPIPARMVKTLDRAANKAGIYPASAMQRAKRDRLIARLTGAACGVKS